MNAQLTIESIGLRAYLGCARVPQLMMPQGFCEFADRAGLHPSRVISVYAYAVNAAKHAAQSRLLPGTLTADDCANAAFLAVCARDDGVPDTDRIMRRRIWRAIRAQCRSERDHGITGRSEDRRAWQNALRDKGLSPVAHDLQLAESVAESPVEPEIDVSAIRDRLRAACRDNRLSDRDVALAGAVLPIIDGQTVLSIADCAREASAEFDCAICDNDVLAACAKLCEIAGLSHGLGDTRSTSQRKSDSARARWARSRA